MVIETTFNDTSYIDLQTPRIQAFIIQCKKSNLWYRSKSYRRDRGEWESKSYLRERYTSKQASRESSTDHLSSDSNTRMWKMPIRLRHRLMSRHPITTFMHATDESEIKNVLISIEELALMRLYSLAQSNGLIRYRKEHPCTMYNWYIPERRQRQSTTEAILLYAFSLVLTYSQSSLIARPAAF